jgi:hypothetical protein
LDQIDDKEEFYSIHLNEIDLEGDKIVAGTTSKNDALKTIENLHSKLKQETLTVEESEDEDTMLFFPNINLAIWVENNLINDICVERPIEEL